MKPFAIALLINCLVCEVAFTAEPPVAPPLKIEPGRVVIPFNRMQRPWGELISLDREQRTGKFRRESNDEVVEFTVMPYAELLHHAANGDLQDFRVGERAIFRLHENDAGEWVYLTYIQDEMNMLLNHKEFYHVDEVDVEKKQVTCTQGNADKSYVREKGIVIGTDEETRFWKQGAPAKFADIQAGAMLRTKSHGVGKGKTRIAWEVFLDEESLLKFQAEQRAVHAERIAAEGAPGYVDAVEGDVLKLTLFHEAESQTKLLKVGKAVRVAPAGVDRKPTAEPVAATVQTVVASGRLHLVTLKLVAPGDKFMPEELTRLWVVVD